MIRKEIEKKIAEMEAGIAELKEKLEKAKDINSDVFIPENYEEYWRITDDGVICRSWWDKTTIDKNRLAIGNVFRTKEEAEFEIERLKVINELRQYAEPRDTKWDGKNDHYYITCTTFNSYENRINVYSSPLYKHHDIYFSSFFRAWEAIEAVGKDRVKKYYLCVED